MTHPFNSSFRWRRTWPLVIVGLVLGLALDLAVFKLLPIPRSFQEQTAPTVQVTPAPPAEVEVDESLPPLERRLSERERYLIAATLGLTAPPTPQGLPGSTAPLMILHDTAGELSREELSARPRYTHSPLGDGIAVYLPREGEPIFTRPALFTPYRPTATAYERGFDLLTEPQRNPLLRQAWRLASDRTRQAVSRQLLGSLQEKPQDLANRMALWFNAKSDSAFNRYLASHPGEIDGGKTAAIWASADLCRRVLKNPEQSWADTPARQQELLQTCQKLQPWAEASRLRLHTAFNVELVQKEGSDCFVSDAQVRAYNQVADPAHRIAKGRAVPLQSADRPAYTDSQYEGLAKLYLLGALTAGRFPQIVTHYWLDQGEGRAIGTHCDPRGVDLNRLYGAVASTLNHPAGTLYGSQPRYGQNPQAGDTVWWSDSIMGGPAPSGLSL